MKCIKCGATLDENDLFCLNCGFPAQRSNNSEDSDYSNNQDNNNSETNTKENIKENSGINMAKIICAILVLLIIISIAAFIIHVNNRDSEKINTSVNNSTTSSIPTQITNLHGMNNQYKVKHKEFNIYIPGNLDYEMDFADNTVIVSDENKNWTAILYIDKIPYEIIRENRDEFPTLFSELYSNYNLSMKIPTVELFEETEYLIIDGSSDETNIMIGISQIDSDYSLCFEAFSNDNEYRKNILENIKFILSNVEYEGNTKYLKQDNSIKVTDISSNLQNIIQNQE